MQAVVEGRRLGAVLIPRRDTCSDASCAKTAKDFLLATCIEQG